MQRHLKRLALLGILCQAMTWDSLLFTWCQLLLTWLAWRWSRSGRHPSEAWDGPSLLIGGLVGFGLSKLTGQNTHFFIGHGLAAVQAIRLMRPLKERDRWFVLVVSFIHLGVGCAVVLDYRFILLWAGMVILIPPALQEMAWVAAKCPTPDRPTWRKAGMPGWGYPVVLTLMILFFLVFPRGWLGNGLGARGGGSSGSLQDSVLDPTRSGSALSSAVLMQVEGENVGYLRSFAMVDMKDGIWVQDGRAFLRRIDYAPIEDLPDYEYRRVRVKQAGYLGRVLPVDGKVKALAGKFFRFPMRNAHEIIEVRNLWNTANNLYEYWVDPTPMTEAPNRRDTRRMLAHEPPTPAVKAWLEETLAQAKSPLERARALEARLRDQFTYDLGAPEISRLNTLEEFLIRDRRGHCERFASALALLCRMEGIPSRIIVGYVPTAPNWLTGWRDVRFKDAHAWTEAWIPGQGWIQMDGTPRASLDLRDPPLREFIDAIDVLWYLNVVNFNVATQEGFWTSVGDQVEQFTANLKKEATWMAPSVILVLFLVWLGLRWKQVWKQGLGRKGTSSQKRSREQASHFYARMLRALERKGWQRPAHLTPREFLARLEAEGYPSKDAAERITREYCRTRYGCAVLTREEEAEVKLALKKIQSETVRKG